MSNFLAALALAVLLTVASIAGGAILLMDTSTDSQEIEQAPTNEEPERLTSTEACLTPHPTDTEQVDATSTTIDSRELSSTRIEKSAISELQRNNDRLAHTDTLDVVARQHAAARATGDTVQYDVKNSCTFDTYSGDVLTSDLDAPTASVTATNLLDSVDLNDDSLSTHDALGVGVYITDNNELYISIVTITE